MTTLDRVYLILVSIGAGCGSVLAIYNGWFGWAVLFAIVTLITILFSVADFIKQLFCSHKDVEQISESWSGLPVQSGSVEKHYRCKRCGKIIVEKFTM